MKPLNTHEMDLWMMGIDEIFVYNPFNLSRTISFCDSNELLDDKSQQCSL